MVLRGKLQGERVPDMWAAPPGAWTTGCSYLFPEDGNMKANLFGILALAVVGSSIIACGGTDSGSDGTFGPGYAQQSATSGNGNNNGGQSGSLGNSGGSSGSTGGGGSTAQCAQATLSAQAEPLHIVFVVDRSGSMCEYDNFGDADCKNKNSKWVQATGALKNFVGSPDSRGIKASMIFFPDKDPTSNSDMRCTVSNYTKPIAPEVTLPDTATLPAAIDKHEAYAGNTPTASALTGAVQYAKSLAAATPNEKYVMVVATDGIPMGCSDQGSISGAAKAVSGVASDIPTYVIGVGDAVSDLDNLAKAGGTTKSFSASNSTPSQTGKLLADALTAIRTASVSCDFAIPAPPAGQTIDFNKVNVEVTTKGTPSTIKYSQDCSDLGGWKYDDANKPTKIELCDTSCGTIKADAYSSVGVVLGCATEKAGVN